MTDRARQIAEAFVLFTYRGRMAPEDFDDYAVTIGKMLASQEAMDRQWGCSIHGFVNGWLARERESNVAAPWCKTSSGAHAHGQFVEVSDGQKNCTFCKEKI